MVLAKVEVGVKQGYLDVLGASVKQKIKEDLKLSGIESISCLDVFQIHSALSEKDLEFTARNLLMDPVIHSFSINKELHLKYSWQITVELHKNMDDTLGKMTLKGIKDLGLPVTPEDFVRTARKYVIQGKLVQTQVKEIAEKVLANNLIEHYEISKGK